MRPETHPQNTRYKGRGSAIMGISRRAVMNGMGQSATLGALAAALPAQLQAAAAAAPAAPAAAPAALTTTYCMTRIYRSAEGVTFDGDAFRNRQLPEMIKAYGKTAERIELRMPAPVAEGKPAPQIIATVNIWFRDVIAFRDRNLAAAKDLAAGMEKITKALANEQVDQVLASLGDPEMMCPSTASATPPTSRPGKAAPWIPNTLRKPFIRSSRRRMAPMPFAASKSPALPFPSPR